MDRNERRKERIIAAKPNLIFSSVVATIVTISFWFKLGKELNNETIGDWGGTAVYAGIFVFTFGFIFLANNWKRYKLKLNNYSLFLILSLIMSGITTWVSKGTWTNFIIGVGCCFAIFYIFWKFDYVKIKDTFLQFIKSLAYGIILPSMFLSIALIGNFDKNNLFMDRVIPQLVKVGTIISKALIFLVQTIYNLGRYEFSFIFIVAIFIFAVFFAVYDFLKKTMRSKTK